MSAHPRSIKRWAVNGVSSLFLPFPCLLDLSSLSLRGGERLSQGKGDNSWKKGPKGTRRLFGQNTFLFILLSFLFCHLLTIRQGFYAWFLTVISNIGMDVCLEEGRLEANNIRLLTTRYYSLPLTHIPLLLSLPFILFPLESSLVSSLLKPYWATLQWVDGREECEREGTAIK